MNVLDERTMHDDGERGDPASRFPPLRESVARFPGPVVIAEEPMHAAIPTMTIELNHDAPWAIDVSYAGPTEHLLTIRTVYGRPWVLAPADRQSKTSRKR